MSSSFNTVSTGKLTLYDTEDSSHRYTNVMDFVEAYTTNRLTLCQAIYGLYNFLNNQYQMLPKIPIKAAFTVLGHRFTDEEVKQQQLGYEGDIDAWMVDHVPAGWYQLFEDNYYQYLDTTEK